MDFVYLLVLYITQVSFSQCLYVESKHLAISNKVESVMVTSGHGPSQQHHFEKRYQYLSSSSGVISFGREPGFLRKLNVSIAQISNSSQFLIGEPRQTLGKHGRVQHFIQDFPQLFYFEFLTILMYLSLFVLETVCLTTFVSSVRPFHLILLVLSTIPTVMLLFQSPTLSFHALNSNMFPFCSSLITFQIFIFFDCRIVE